MSSSFDKSFLVLKRVWLLVAFFFTLPVCAQDENVQTREDINMKKIIFEHILDSYEWHITKIGERDITLYLPVIVYSQTSGWHCFSSNKLYETNGGAYQGLQLGRENGPYEGRIVEIDSNGQEIRPFDMSITKNVLSLFINSAILIALVLYAAKWYRKRENRSKAPGGFIGLVEMLVMMVNDDIIKDSVGPNYKKFAPYLLTAFFFIFINNLMGLIPLFPGGANVTGNIAVTFVMAVFTFVMVNLFGTKHYWKDIFWPDVPWWLKVPIPIMPLVEVLGIFTKPIALMIRLFANIMSGHISILVLTGLIFMTAKMGALINGSMTFIAFIFDIFMNCLELLVAFIQAYVFTMLSAVFIGLAQDKGEKEGKTNQE